MSDGQCKSASSFHEMQARESVENAVCLSLCTSGCMNITETVNHGGKKKKNVWVVKNSVAAALRIPSLLYSVNIPLLSRCTVVCASIVLYKHVNAKSAVLLRAARNVLDQWLIFFFFSADQGLLWNFYATSVGLANKSFSKWVACISLLSAVAE